MRGLRVQLELAGVSVAILVLLVFLSLEGLGLGPGELWSDHLGLLDGQDGTTMAVHQASLREWRDDSLVRFFLSVRSGCHWFADGS